MNKKVLTLSAVMVPACYSVPLHTLLILALV